MPQDDGSKEEEDSFSRQALPRGSTRYRFSVTAFADSVKASGTSFFGKTAAAAGSKTRKVTGVLGSLRNLTSGKSSRHSLTILPTGGRDDDESSSSEEEDSDAEDDGNELGQAGDAGDEDYLNDPMIASFFEGVDGGATEPRMTKQPSGKRSVEEAPMGRKPSLTRMDPSIAAEFEKLRQENERLLADNERLNRVIKTTEANYEWATAQAQEAKAKAEATLEASVLLAQAAVPESEVPQTEQPSAGPPAKGKPGKGKPPPPGKGKAGPPDATASQEEPLPTNIPAIPPPSKGKAGPPALPSKGGGDAGKGCKGPGPPPAGGKGPGGPPGKGPPPVGKGGPPPAGGKGPATPGGQKGVKGAPGDGGKGKAGGKGAAGKGGIAKAAGPAITGKKWHWKTLKHQESAGTVFDSLLGCDKETIGRHWRIDVAMLKDLFVEVAVKKDDAAAKKGSKAMSELTVFDAKRTQNLAIGVVGLRNNCHTEVPDLVAALQALDFASAALCNIDVIELVLTLLPSPEEAKELKKIPEEDKERLRSLEKDILLLTSVPRLQFRLRLSFFAGKAKDIEADIMERLDTLEKAAKSALESKDLEFLLSVSLGIGCYINQSFLADGFTGASEGLFAYAPVGGFKLESLVRMKETAAAKHHTAGFSLIHAVLLHLARLLKDEQKYVQDEDVEPLNEAGGDTSPNAAPSSPSSVPSERSSISRRSSQRSSSSARRQLTPALYALKRWHAKLTEDLASVGDASKTVLVEVEDEVRELTNEARFVSQEASEENLRSYEGPAEASLVKLNESAQALVERISSKMESTKGQCEDLCAYFGEKLKSSPTALSDTTQVIFSALAEAIGGPITKGVEDLCGKKAPAGLPEPEMLNFESLKAADKPADKLADKPAEAF